MVLLSFFFFFPFKVPKTRGSRIYETIARRKRVRNSPSVGEPGACAGSIEPVRSKKGPFLCVADASRS